MPIPNHVCRYVHCYFFHFHSFWWSEDVHTWFCVKFCFWRVNSNVCSSITIFRAVLCLSSRFGVARCSCFRRWHHDIKIERCKWLSCNLSLHSVKGRPRDPPKKKQKETIPLYGQYRIPSLCGDVVSAVKMGSEWLCLAWTPSNSCVASGGLSKGERERDREHTGHRGCISPLKEPWPPLLEIPRNFTPLCGDYK